MNNMENRPEDELLPKTGDTEASDSPARETSSESAASDVLPEGVLEAEIIGEAMVLSSSDMNKAKKKKKKMKTPVKVALIVSAVLLSLVVLLCGAAYGVFLYYYSMLEVEQTDAVSGNYEQILDALNRGEVLDLSGLSEEELDMVRRWEELQKLKDQEQNQDTPQTEEQNTEDISQIQDDFEPVLDLDRNDNLINILLIGQDAEGAVSHLSRSDVMVLVTINPYTKSIYMTSFLRDSYVKIPGIGWDKLNHSYAYGGASLTIATIEQNFGCAIDNYAAVDFEVFSEIIDILGGVDIKVSDAELKALRDDTGRKLSVKNGALHMDGKVALSYCRLRSIDSDVQRTERQRKVIGALVEKAKNTGISELMQLMSVIFPKVKTDLSQQQCGELIAKAMSISSYSVVSQRIPKDKTYYSTYIKGTFYWILDFDANRKFWNDTAGQMK